MRFTPTPIDGVVIVDPEPASDERGLFARTWDPEEFLAHGLDPQVRQCSVSYNVTRGTLRGLHYQAEPHAEVKLVRVTAGAVLDVAVDLRAGSPTYRGWVGVELTADNRRALYVPQGCAHGLFTLVDGTEVFYQISAAFVAEAVRGVRWDDPAIGIGWPGQPQVMSDRDRSWPLLDGPPG